MTDKARELLERALKGLENRKDEVADWGAYASDYFQKKWCYEDSIIEFDGLMEEIRAYLAQPEVKREALSDEELLKQWSVAFQYGHVDRATFIYGVRWAEKMHKIGDSNE